MSKYVTLTKLIYGIFGTPEWADEGIATVPSDYSSDDLGDKYIRVSVLPSGRGVNLSSGSGQIIVDIFTPAGKGPLEAATIADRLDAYLVGKSKQIASGVVQMRDSSLSHGGPDKANPALARSTYVVPFNFFGV